MARAKRSSAVLETARRRIAGLKSINPAPKFGATMTPEMYEQKAEALDARVNGYNQMLSAADAELNGIEADESELNDLNKRYLAATGAQYGQDSSEYEAMGGTRLSERKKPKARGSGGTPPPTP
ncbi:MAG TPA: hypothetical protein VGN90_15400 [Pyrinomonadaceae bacterium]|nr:hypothetical protein [Pyrinomonadaceae bacterium]